MKKIIYALFIIVITLSSFTLVHKFYVSVTQIDYNKEQKSLQIISRIFIDDMERLLRERYNESLTLVSEGDESLVDAYIAKYLQQKLKIAVNDKEVTFNFIGKEYENDLLLCYLEVENIDSFEKIAISNSILTEIFEEQQNIVHVKKGNQRKSLILRKEKEEDVLKFSK